MHGVETGPVGDLPAARLAVTGGEIGTCSLRSLKSRSPTAMEIPYFSFFSPYVPAIPQQSASSSITRRSGMRASRSRAGLPIPCPRC